MTDPEKNLTPSYEHSTSKSMHKQRKKKKKNYKKKKKKIKPQNPIRPAPSDGESLIMAASSRDRATPCYSLLWLCSSFLPERVSSQDTHRWLFFFFFFGPLTYFQTSVQGRRLPFGRGPSPPWRCQERGSFLPQVSSPVLLVVYSIFFGIRDDIPRVVYLSAVFSRRNSFV